jgi:hypothetical protein
MYYEGNTLLCRERRIELSQLRTEKAETLEVHEHCNPSLLGQKEEKRPGQIGWLGQIASRIEKTVLNSFLNILAAIWMNSNRF